MSQDFENYEDLEIELEEGSWEYFHNRPVLAFFHLTLNILAGLFGIIANLIIVIMMTKKGRLKNGIQVLILNFALLLIADSYFIIDIVISTYYGTAIASYCYVRVFLSNFPIAVELLTSVALIIASKYFSNLSMKSGISIVIVNWIIGILCGYSYYDYEIVKLPMTKNRSLKLCSPRIDSTDDYKSYLNRLFIVEYITPTIILFIIGIVLQMWKKSDTPLGNKNIFLYSLIAGGTSFLPFVHIATYMGLLRFFEIQMQFKVHMLLSHLGLFVVIANPIALCYYDRTFYKDLRKFLRIDKSDDLEHQMSAMECIVDEGNE